MDSSNILLIVTISLALLLVVLNKIRMDVAALIIACLLGIYQLAGLQMVGPAGTPQDAVKAISGFSQPVVITLISLFIMTSALEKSGIPRWFARRIMRLGGSRPSAYIGLFALFSACMSLFMNNLAAAALLLPSAMEVARRTGMKPSKLLIPVAYGSLLGGAATYFTTANIVVSDLLRMATPTQTALGILDFTPTGGLIALAGIFFLWFFGNRLLPDRESSHEQLQARLTGSELEDFYQLGDRLWEGHICKDSPIIQKSIRETGIGKQWGVAIAAIRNEKSEFDLPYPDTILMPKDTLILVGRQEKINSLKELKLEIHPARQGLHLTTRGLYVVEILLTPHSRILGQTLKGLDFRQRYGVTIVGIRRLNRSYRTDVGDFPLAFGDSLLVISDIEHIKRLKHTNDFIVLEPNPADQPLRIKQAYISTIAIIGAIIAAVAGLPVYLATLAGAILTMLLGAVAVDEAYQSVHWQAIFLIGGMYAVSLAMVQTGMAADMGNILLQVIKPLGGIGLAAGAYLVTAALTQLMGGQVTALVTGPVMIAAAISMGVNPQAVAVATAIGCSASFLTPMAHPVNVLMIGPGNYEFKDFTRVGWMLTVISFVMMVVGLALFWNL